MSLLRLLPLPCEPSDYFINKHRVLGLGYGILRQVFRATV
jgi:hypothetical protein